MPRARKDLRILVVGLGSMGRRRIRLLKGIDSQMTVAGVDLSADRCRQAEKECDVRTWADLSSALGDFNPVAVVVSTSPLSHGPIVMSCLKHGVHVFTELNLVKGWYKRAMRMAGKKGLQLFVSSTFLYRRELQYVARAVRGKTVNYIYHSGQYLPDWHPWESYKDFFVANKRTNACREILAIEFPWLINAFGEIESVHVMRDRNSRLDIDFPDNYIISIRHKNGNKGVFCQDIVSRKGLRRLEVYSEELHLFWEGTPQSLAKYDLKKREMRDVRLYEDVEQNSQYNSNIIENMYRDELVAFLKCIRGKSVARYTFADDFKVLSLIDRVEGGASG